ncbi:MAG: phenylacetate--CoA ligase family protein [Nitrospirae bacterium]|nr:phenylacetate--CoA ligase family protein [Candidatus Manganitrophaceae bacterium]
MNKFVAKYLIYFPIQFLRRQNVSRHLSQVSGLQYKSPHEIEALRDAKIERLIRHAYNNNPFYKKKFDDLGVRSDEIKGMADLSRLPVLLKREVLDNEKTLITPHFGQKLYTRKTGGSTGMTLHFMKEADVLAQNDAIMYRCYDWYGIDIGERQVRFWGVPVTSNLRWKEAFKDLILNRIRISAFDISEASCLKQYEQIKKFKPTYFYGYTTAIYGFCLFMKKLDIDLNMLNLKAVICTAEKMYDHHRELFREVFNCPIVDEYGSSENGILAFQCKNGNMHIMSDHMCIEFLDEKDRPVKPGELGRIVVTDLASYGMPLLRYDIGDMGRPSEKTCSCGVRLPLMDIVEGRKEDFIRTKDGKLVHAAYLCYTLKDDTVSEFKMYQKDLNTLLVYIVKSPNFSSDTEKILDRKLRTSLGEEMRITFEYLERIPREKSGKLRYFVSEINQS